MTTRRQDFVTPEGLRLDGRKPQQIRKVVLKVGSVDEAEGSAYLEQGNTKILALVHGPYQDDSRRSDRCLLHVEFTVAAFATSGSVVRRQNSRLDKRNAEYSSVVASSLESLIAGDSLANTNIDIYLQVLQADGSLLASSLNAAAVALIDAGIPMRDFLVACTAGTAQQRASILDLNSTEESGKIPFVTVAATPRSKEIVSYTSQGRVPIDSVPELTSLAVSGCSQIFGIFEKTITQLTIERVRCKKAIK